MILWPLASPRVSHNAHRSWSKRHPRPPEGLQWRWMTSCSWHLCSSQNPEQIVCNQFEIDPWDVFMGPWKGGWAGGERAWEKEGIQAAQGLGNNGSSFRCAHPPSAGSSGLLQRWTPSSILWQAQLSAYSNQLPAVKYWGIVSIFKAELSILHLLV